MKKLLLVFFVVVGAVSCTADEAIKKSLTNINEELIVMQKSITDNQIAIEELNAINSATQSDIAANSDAIAELRAEIAYLNNEILLIKNSGSKGSYNQQLKPKEVQPAVKPEAGNTVPLTNETPVVTEELFEETTSTSNATGSSNQQIIIIEDSIAAKSSIYSYAMELNRMKKHDEARVKFQEYIDKYPTDKLAGNAQYWIGETYYTVNDMPKALSAFELVRNNFPQSVKVPDSMLKIGYVQDKLGDRAGAVVVLKELVKAYPKSSAATLANQKLRAWGK